MQEARQGLFSKATTQQKKTTMQRSNRVYILQYSPQRSKSKKQKWEQADPKKEKISSFLIRKDLLDEGPSKQGEQFSHRRNIDRLTNLISKSRNISTNQGESGCQKLVKALERVLKIRSFQADSLERIKRYCMLSSSTNYQLFIQSKHGYCFTKELSKKTNDYGTLEPLSKICENQMLEYSGQSSQFSPVLDRRNQENQITFRNKIREMSQSICQNLQSPKKFFEEFKTKNNIKTAETLNSHEDLDAIDYTKVNVSKKIQFLGLKENFKHSGLLQMPLRMLIKSEKQIQFLHLCHFKSEVYQKEEGLQVNCQVDVNSLAKIIFKSALKLTTEPAITSQFNRNRLDFALPTSISPSNQQQNNQARVNYFAESVQAQTSKKLKKSNEMLTAKAIADRMLFGDKPAQPIKRQEEKIDPQPIKKRVSSLPKITFTYSSRDKDFREANVSPAMKQYIPLRDQGQSRLKKAADTLKPIIRVEPNKMIVKQQLQSTFQSTKSPTNAFQSNPNYSKSPHNHQKILTYAREINHNPFGNRPIPSPAINNNNEYYNGPILPSTKASMLSKQQLRERLISHQPNHQIQYVGIEEQPGGCCWTRKVIRSRSLNDRVLVGLPQKNLPLF